MFLEPGDSVYVQPNVPHAFASEGSRMFVVRIPGNLTREVAMEVALCDGRGRSRVGNETSQWYN